MMSGVLRMEAIKMRTTRSTLWVLVLVAAVSLGLTTVNALSFRSVLDKAKDGDEGVGDLIRGQITVEGGVMMLVGFGSVLVLILGVLAVTGEYRHGTIETTFQAVPRRYPVLCGKVAVYGGVSALVVLLVAPLESFLFKAGLGHYGDGLEVFGSDALRLYWVLPLYAVLLTAMAVGVGALVRHTAGALAVLLLWKLVFESVVGMLGDWGRTAQAYLPFINFERFFGNGLMHENIDFPWGPTGSLLYFVAICLALFAAGVVTTMRRDA